LPNALGSFGVVGRDIVPDLLQVPLCAPADSC
jgi:hypothetical protein